MVVVSVSTPSSGLGRSSAIQFVLEIILICILYVLHPLYYVCLPCNGAYGPKALAPNTQNIQASTCWHVKLGKLAKIVSDRRPGHV